MRKLLIVVAVAVAVLVAWHYSSAKPKRAWTTSSQAALDEFGKALEAKMKFYHMDASEHLRRALELDPEFAAAKVMRMDYVRGAEAKRLLDELAQTDLDHLSPREAMMVSFFLASRQGNPEASRKVAEAFLEKHPKDPYGLSFLCSALEDPLEQETCYRKLIAVEPNFVLAQNNLGYLAMGQGEFREAEERFRTYQYIAPGQANPHDSMGELLVLLGRYDDARRELEAALALRPDFDASHTSLVRAALLQEHVEDAQAAVQRGERAGLGREWLQCMGCEILLRQLSTHTDWEAVWTATDACRMLRCTDVPMYYRHRAALATGRHEEARRIEEEAARMAADRGKTPRYGSRFWPAVDEHLRGVRLTFEGRQEEAVAAFEKADEHLAYVGFRDGSLKLQNRLALAQLLRDGGMEEEAEALEDAVRRINPDFLRESVRFRSPAAPAR